MALASRAGGLLSRALRGQDQILSAGADPLHPSPDRTGDLVGDSLSEASDLFDADPLITVCADEGDDVLYGGLWDLGDVDGGVVH